MASLYSLSAVEDVLRQYNEHGGWIEQLDEGCLGYGLLVCGGEGLKYCIITEVYLNEWSSAHKIRFYRELPQKYQKMLDELD